MVTPDSKAAMPRSIRDRGSGAEPNASSRVPPWLSSLPRHWAVTSLSRLTTSRCDGPFGSGLKFENYRDSGRRVIRLQNIGSAHFVDSNAAFISEDYYQGELGDHGVQSGDLLIAGLGDEGHPVGRACVAPDSLGPAMVKADVFRFRLDPRLVHPAFLAHHLSATAPAFAAVSTTGSTRARVNLSRMAARPVGVPPTDEQRTIADFLDRETERIDALVAKKQRLIELLQEKRTALISHAVTKGPDPDAPTKDSGIDWLDAIPKHWPLIRLGHSARVQNGSTPSRDDAAYWVDGTIPWLASTKVNEDRVTGPSELITELALHECSLSLMPAGSVIIGLVGQGRTRGMAALLDMDATINQNMAAIIPRGRIVGRYLQYQLEHMYKPIRECGRGANQAALNCELVADLRLPLPPPEEQVAIARLLDAEIEAGNALADKARQSIDLLMESRSALITAAVTGQIDVSER